MTLLLRKRFQTSMIARHTVRPLTHTETSRDIGGKHGVEDIVDAAPTSTTLLPTGQMPLSTELHLKSNHTTWLLKQDIVVATLSQKWKSQTLMTAKLPAKRSTQMETSRDIGGKLGVVVIVAAAPMWTTWQPTGQMPLSGECQTHNEINLLKNQLMFYLN